MAKSAIGWFLGIGAIAAGAGLYLINTSWLAEPPGGRPTLIAQRGLHQVYDLQGVTDDTCTAQHIRAPVHLLIDNTLPSIAAAISAGADVVEIDVRVTSDGQFVLFHDNALDCRTDGTGTVFAHTLAELKTLDVGYGYTADEGRSHPLRGKGSGLMPSLEEALTAYPGSRFLIQIKDGDHRIGEMMAAYLERRGMARWDRLAFFGAPRPLSRLKNIHPGARTWSAAAAARCLSRYLLFGWTGHVPEACDDAVVMVPIMQSDLVWGWPNRFLQRMRGHRTEVILIGRIDGLSGADFSRLDTEDEIRRVPHKFDGSIWTDRIEITGPALMARPTY
jgi:glycerophosphoryl diester phosphodiesterase